MTTATGTVECNICHWQGNEFQNESGHPQALCPNCRSEARHRLLMAALANLDTVGFANLVQDRRVLHFAPERVLANFLRARADEYRSADFARRDVDLRLDISHMPEVADESFDLVVACDALERVEYDRGAMREIHRILSPRGWTIITVPQKDNPATVFVDPSVTKPEDRERMFGRHDHRRIYGDDFPEILSEAGFDVTAISEQSLPEDMVRRHVLFPPVLSARPLATNHRKLFFGRKRRLVSGPSV
ncbi:MAG: methyltransferase domain-containing protein [Phycisphaerales bacterium]|nr:MAG: methyltransferase domain-containing protein [Phycisphaerales bacterium]